MVDVQRTQADFDALLLEQLSFLKSSAAAYDAGFDGEVKRLAVSVRVLVHDTKGSTSLLTHCGKKGIQFVDTAIPYDDEDLLSHSSLVQIHLGAQAKAKPHLDDSGTAPSLVEFDRWWNGVVLVDAKKNEFSRRDIALNLANKDGGAHVDHKIDERYHQLREKNSLGWKTVLGDGREIAGEDHVPATMRQIAHELIKSLEPGYSCVRPPDPDAAMVISSMSFFQGDRTGDAPSRNLTATRPKVNGRKVGRNDLCPCGSGKKYKKCHI